jgi:hypothetical protein
MTRKLDVSVEGEENMGDLIKRFHEAVDDPYWNYVEGVNFVSPEVPEVAPGQINIEVTEGDGHPEGMEVETDAFLNREFSNASVTLIPSDEEIEAMKP